MPTPRTPDSGVVLLVTHTSSPVGESADSDADIAWMLANAADQCLSGHEREMLYVELGCGEHHLAIERSLRAAVSSKTALPAAVVARLSCRLDGHAGIPEEPTLRTLLDELRAQPFQQEIKLRSE